MATRAGLFLSIVLTVQSVAREWPRELIVWNVGQGQWVTLADDHACWHFDAGGEFAPWRQITARCRSLVNGAVFSHWDLDHVGFAGLVSGRLPGTCLSKGPPGTTSPRKRNLLSKLSPCAESPPSTSWLDASAKGPNAMSRVSLMSNVLIPGDAPRATERRFLGVLKGLSDARWLILGHHGSRTSTSDELLRATPHLRGAIASARRARYGHPHAQTLRRLTEAHVPVLVTEDWGTVHVAL